MPIKGNCTAVSSCNKYRYRKQRLVLRCICELHTLYLCCGSHLSGVKESEGHGSMSQTDACPDLNTGSTWSWQEAAYAPLFPLICRQYPTCISGGTRAHCWNVWCRHLLPIILELLRKETDESSVTYLHKNNGGNLWRDINIFKGMWVWERDIFIRSHHFSWY